MSLSDSIGVGRVTKLDKDELKRELEKFYNTSNHPKREKLFELAWEYGHGHGSHEVDFYYDDLIDLIR
ncbi:hypothetical protein AR9_g097 [Bacillus phage AR9]|uniref:Uncharacterized protein n=2 Tax=Bacillus phage PBS1 TaxID=10683 RepID=A0A172JI06_BPPB1|nr:hypothetical protein BI022_gp096 [Bacillus phage AR9]YP_009664494.1 hypothetical protein FK780_gp154 [Bacillus phage PBS1]AMS01181.1 hypothetical protein AR9_g097 [Bacillus phage AR9]ASU00115.1 hypothetical protein PBI_PBS1_293 [Bacillus phage PBS1]BDE75376.1 hypothetical protein [Bacillus phage PBS1]